MITQIKLSNVDLFKNIVWDLKGKRLAIVYGEYRVNKLLFKTLIFFNSLLNKNNTHQDFFSKSNPEFEFSLESES